MNETGPDDPRHGRPLGVSVAGGILIVTGLFAGMIGLVLLIVALANVDPQGLPAYIDALPDGFVGAAVLVGTVMLAYGAIQTLTGVQAVRGRGWARAAGIGLAAFGAVILGFAMLAPGREPGSGAAPVIFAPIIAGLAYAAAVLASESAWFRRWDGHRAPDGERDTLTG